MKLYDINAIRTLEKLAIEKYNIGEDTLMERAGKAAFEQLRQLWPSIKHMGVLCGKGNNAGDGYVVARLAHEKKINVTIYALTKLNELQGAAKRAALAAETAGVKICPLTLGIKFKEELLVDALLGIGLSGEVREPFFSIIQHINTSKLPIFAIDTPSGLDVGNGIVLGCAIQAAATMTFIGLKPGLFTAQGVAFAGEVFCDELGIPNQAFEQVNPSAKLLTKLMHFSKRARNAHKGDFGHVLIMGGDEGMAGAVRMAGEAALRVGAGLVTVATQPHHVSVVSSQRPELMCRGITQADDLTPLIERACVIVVGPGLGQREWGSALLNAAIASRLPLVVDADGLNLLAKSPRQRENWLLTPHPGEASRLLHCTPTQIQTNRLSSASDIVRNYNGICVLKGAGTVVKAKNVLPVICHTGNPGMATAGMGDVLSGILGGLIAQGLTLFEVAKQGVMLHGEAANLAAKSAGERGLLALDLMPLLQALVNQS